MLHLLPPSPGPSPAPIRLVTGRFLERLLGLPDAQVESGALLPGNRLPTEQEPAFDPSGLESVQAPVNESQHQYLSTAVGIELGATAHLPHSERRLGAGRVITRSRRRTTCKHPEAATAERKCRASR